MSTISSLSSEMLREEAEGKVKLAALEFDTLMDVLFTSSVCNLSREGSEEEEKNQEQVKIEKKKSERLISLGNRTLDQHKPSKLNYEDKLLHQLVLFLQHNSCVSSICSVSPTC